MAGGDVTRIGGGRIGGSGEIGGGPIGGLDGIAAGRGDRALILSNGHGEDAMGAKLGEELLRRGVRVTALPIVGEGDAYTAVGIPLARAGKALPSGGFSWRSSVRAVIGDFRAGFWQEWRDQRAALRREAADADVLVGVGDSVLVGMVALLRSHPPFVFLPTAKSVYNSRFYRFERRWMRRHCAAVYPRDAETAVHLRRAGLPAHFVGNLMMDLLDPTGEWPGGVEADADRRPAADTGARQPGTGVRRVALLPGSRDEAYANLHRMLPVLEAVERMRPGAVEYAVALAGGLEDARLEDVVSRAGWRVHAGCWKGPAVEGGGPRLYPVRGAFPDVLRWSEVVLGMAGTASEQAVGLGRPVVSFAGDGPQFTERFADGQRRLLGESVTFVRRRKDDPGPIAAPERVARQLLAVLDDDERRARMADVGRARMGDPGGASGVADGVVRVLHPEPPLMSVVIPTYNRRALLEQVLDSLADQALPNRGGGVGASRSAERAAGRAGGRFDRAAGRAHPFEVVVVDDGSTDGTADWCESVRDRYPFPLRLVAGRHRGRAHTRNAGVRAAVGELVVLLDSDVVVGPQFIAGHFRAHDMAAGWPVPSSRIGHGAVVHSSDPVKERTQNVQPGLKDMSNAFFATANVSIARTHLIAAGLFDEEFQEYGWEDLELGARLKRLGLRKVKAPGAIGYHYEEPFRAAALPAALAKERERGHTAVLYNRKHDHWEVRTSTLAIPIAFWLDRLQNVGGWADRDDAPARIESLERRGRTRLARFLGKRLLFHTYMNGMREAGIDGALKADRKAAPAPSPDGRTNS